MGWYSNVISGYARLGQNLGNFQRTPISTPIPDLKHSKYILIHQIVKELKNHHEMAIPLQTSFTYTKHAQGKHNVQASQKNTFLLVTHTFYSNITPKQGY